MHEGITKERLPSSLGMHLTFLVMYLRGLSRLSSAVFMLLISLMHILRPDVAVTRLYPAMSIEYTLPGASCLSTHFGDLTSHTHTFESQPPVNKLPEIRSDHILQPVNGLELTRLVRVLHTTNWGCVISYCRFYPGLDVFPELADK